MTLAFDLEPGDGDLFREEALELVDALEAALLELESGRRTSAMVDGAFRSAHTLKGSAATIGHQRMAHLAHAMEDLLGRVRSDGHAPVARIAAELLAAVDVLRLLVDEVRVGHALAADPAALGRRFAELLAEISAVPGKAARDMRPTPSSIQQEPEPRAVAASLDAVLVCRIDPASEWRAVRMLQVVMEADASGRLLGSDPDLAAIEADRVGDELRLTLAGAADTSALELRLAGIEDVVTVERVAVEDPSQQPVDGDVAEDTDPAPADATTLAISSDPVAPGSAPATDGAAHAARTTIRVDVARLDDLMNLVGELVVQKTRLAAVARRARERLGDDPLTTETAEGARQLAMLGGQIHDSVNRLRMLPLATVFDGLPRLARDTAHRLGREVTLHVEGSDVELDRAILEGLGGPLAHLVRNAIDHGIEPAEQREAAGKERAGRVTVSASQSEGRVSILVEDDGKGVDLEAVRRVAAEQAAAGDAGAARIAAEDALEVLFRPGFSTAGQVTEISGRGVGLDAVRAELARLGGSVSMTSEAGRGTRITLSLPLTLAIVDALLVRSGGSTYAIPMTGIAETLRTRRDAILRVAGRQAIFLRGRVVEAVPLFTALARSGAEIERGGDDVDLVVIRSSTGEMALAVDQLIGHQEIVLKRVDTWAAPNPGLAAATILPDGSVGLVVDIHAVLRPVAPVPALGASA